ncbi:unnamed protein product, partial [Rotaria magnacalcarata]
MANDLTFSTILMFIPKLTEYRYYRAHRYAKSIGKGVVVDDTKTSTIRYEDYQLEHFIEFIVSPPICQSSLFSMLNECTASTRRSLQGLDSFSAEGSTAFDFLISIVDGLSTL